MADTRHIHLQKARDVDVARLLVVAPNFKKRLSGVTSTIIQLLPLQAQRFPIASLGAGLPDFVPCMRRSQVFGLLKRPQGRPFRIWHARRNVEMIGGILLRDVLRAPVKLVFTSAAQRDHKPFTKWLIRRMDAVIATSARSGSFLHVPHTVIRHGVDLAAFVPAADRDAAVAEAGFAGQRLIGCFGRVREQKGTDLFVAAMIALLPSRPGWTAVITGRVTDDNRAFAEGLKAQIAAAGLSERIRFLGEVPDIKLWYQRVSLYVAPSRNEGFGLTPLEAMASGAAVVASDAGAYAEMIVPGETGAVAPAGDGAALQRAIQIYLDEPALADAHGSKALAHVRATFPLDGEADAIQGVYERLWRGAPS
ncbi:glycosyltransferase family 4 protein [Tianweitania aestuarii]|uniref:glycosyltransferase family 4 protein n=1 Tax=Tianweitania aestuarii TaxID=2814886 RepID=UPI003D649CD8